MPSRSTAPLPLDAVRAVALHAQGLAAPGPGDAPPTLDALYRAVERVGCVQIDTLQVIQRSQYVTLWSRLGSYRPADLDRLVYDPGERRLFEYWQHAASLIPLAAYRYTLPKMAYYRNGGGWWPEWSRQPDNIALAERVLARIREAGPLRAADFEGDDSKRGSWWDWKPAKHALEYLYNVGKLMITRRDRFQRVYDLRERVLPGWVDTTPPTPDETTRFLIEQAGRALGIAAPGHLADYAFLKRGEATPAITALRAEGVLVEVNAEVMDGKTAPLLVHRATLPLVEQAADGALTAARTTFLSPFDSLFWARGRDRLVWGFRQTLEAYRREPDRIWGYFCLPILHGGQLVGRFDPRLERKTGTLRLKALYLEPGIAPDEQLVADVAGALRSFLDWHGAQTLVIERSAPPEWGDKLLAAL